MKTRKFKIIFLLTILVSLVMASFTFLSMNNTQHETLNSKIENKDVNYCLDKESSYGVDLQSSLAQTNSTTLNHNFEINLSGGSTLIYAKSVLEIKRNGSPDWLFLNSEVLNLDAVSKEYVIDIEDIQANNKFRARIEVFYTENGAEQPKSKDSDEITFEVVPVINSLTVGRRFTNDKIELKVLAILSSEINNKTTLWYRVAKRDIGSTEEPVFGNSINFEPGSTEKYYTEAIEGKEYKFEVGGKYNLNGSDINISTKTTNWESIDKLPDIKFNTLISKDFEDAEKFIINVNFNTAVHIDPKFQDLKISLVRSIQAEREEVVVTAQNPEVSADNKRYTFKTGHNGFNDNTYRGYVSFKYGKVEYYNYSTTIMVDKAPKIEKAQLKYIPPSSTNNAEQINKIRLEYKLSNMFHVQKVKLHLHVNDNDYSNPPNIHRDDDWKAVGVEEEIELPVNGREYTKDYDKGEIEWKRWYMVKIIAVLKPYNQQVEIAIRKSQSVYVGKRKPTAKPILLTKHGNKDVFPSFTFLAKLDNLAENDVHSTIKRVDYRLFSSTNSNGRDPIDTKINSVGEWRQNNFETLLMENEHVKIDPNKWYSVKATIYYDLGEGDIKEDVQDSSWVKLQYTPSRRTLMNNLIFIISLSAGIPIILIIIIVSSIFWHRHLVKKRLTHPKKSWKERKESFKDFWKKLWKNQKKFWVSWWHN